MKKKLLALLLTMLLLLPQAFAVSAIQRVQDEGLMQGYTDGLFHEDDAVTRAQMAQIIYSMQTGAADAATFAKLTTSFTDIGGHWAAGAIKYCAGRSYVRGRSATTFAPEETITAREACKILLISELGKSESADGLTGAKWATNTDALARQYNLYRGLSGEPGDALTRGDAAQMLCNALDAK